MTINERIVSLKDGRTCLLRTPEERDAGQLLRYLQVMSTETIYVLSYPEEMIVNLEEEITFIKNIRESANRYMIAAFVGDELAGTAQINIHTKIKTKHRANLGIGLLEKFCNLGLGSQMIDYLIEIAQDKGCELLELEVIQGNHRAIALYERKGFARFGERKRGIRLKDGSYLSEYLMYKDLTSSR